MPHTVHIVACAAQTAVGLTAESAAAAVRAGVSRVTLHPFLMDGAGESLRCAMAGGLDPEPLGTPRIAGLAQRAKLEVGRKLGLAAHSQEKISLFVALSEPRPGLLEKDAAHIARMLAMDNADGLPPVAVERTGEGHAGALYALAVGFHRISQGQESLCICGGVDSYFNPDTLDWLDAKRRIAREGIRGGFIPGEAAAFVVLASDDARRRFAWPSLARVSAVATGQELRLLDSDEGLLGEGLTAVVERIVHGLRFPQERIDETYCDINGERHRSDEWGFTLLRLGSRFRDGSAYTTAVSEWGDVGAASGALGCILAAQAFRRGYSKGNRALIWGSSWGGLRSAVLLEKGAG